MKQGYCSLKYVHALGNYNPLLDISFSSCLRCINFLTFGSPVHDRKSRVLVEGVYVGLLIVLRT
jgi:hypothetical protein